MNERTELARRLRRDSTDAEDLLWQRLRARQLEGAKFVRQLPVGRYVFDFCCRAARLIIEVDGGQHADSAADRVRTGALEASGYLVIRFWNNDVLGNIDGVVEQIVEKLRIARPS